MTRLLHVTTTGMSLELLLGPQLRAFRDLGYDVHTASAVDEFTPRLVADGIVHHPVRHAKRSMAPARDLAAFAELYRLFRHLRPDIVHTHNPKPGIYGRMAARAARVPIIVNTQHGLYAQRSDGFAKRSSVYALERIAAACSHIELVQNPEDIETLVQLRVPRSKLRLLGNGIDLDRFRAQRGDVRAAMRAELGVDDDTVVVGAIGRLVWEKGYGELFTAARRLLKRRTDIAFVIAGPADPDKDDLLTAQDIADAAAAGVRFLGMRDDPERLYAGLDVYVLASHREGFPRAAMEAAASGLPIVATDIRGCRQVVDRGTNGLLVPPRDAAALEAAIERLADDGTERARFGAASSAKAAAEFDQRDVISRTVSAYEEALIRRAERERPPR